MRAWKRSRRGKFRRFLKEVYVNLVCGILKFYHSFRKTPYSVKIGKTSFVIFPGVFDPKISISSVLLANKISVKPNESVLDMGTGSDILAIIAAKQAKDVIAIDINPHAIQCTYINTNLQKVNKKVSLIISNLFTALGKGELFDLIIFNPPYFRKSARNMIERAWCNTNILQFLSQSKHFLKPKGRILITYSSMGDLESLHEAFDRLGFSAKNKEEKSLFFEKIHVFELKERT
ncbi:MAG: methyltransferase [Promethearchaeota archaeon]